MTASRKLPVLVSGAGGFIGASVVARLLESGCPVQAIHRSRDAARRAEARFRSPLFQPIVLDLEADGAAGLAPSGPLLGAIHLAARVPTNRGDDRNESADAFRRGVEAPARAFLALAAGRAPILVHASSTTVYDPERRGPIDETAPLKPWSAYGAAKLACERLFAEHGDRFGCAVANLRLTQVWGPGEPHGLFAQRVFIPAARSGGTVTLIRGGRDIVDLVWRDDAVDALLAALERGASGSFNIASGKGMTVRRIAEAIAAHTGRPAAPGAGFIELMDGGGDAAVRVYDPARARRELGYAPRVSMQEALRRLCR